MLEQCIYIFSLACISYVITAGFRIYLKLRGSTDFSYLAIVIVGTYSTALGLSHGLGLFPSFCLALLVSMSFSVLLLRIMTRLHSIYFTIGTFGLYILVYYLVNNLDVTQGSNGISIKSALLSNAHGINAIMYGCIALGVIGTVTYFRQTLLYKMLQGWGELKTATRTFGIRERFFVLGLILTTTVLAVLGGVMYLEFYAYVSPTSFWIGFLTTLIATTYASYIFGEWMTFVITFGLWYCYELIRFVRIVDPSKIGYFREMLFALFVMIVVFFVFRRLKISREI